MTLVKPLTSEEFLKLVPGTEFWYMGSCDTAPVTPIRYVLESFFWNGGMIALANFRFCDRASGWGNSTLEVAEMTHHHNGVFRNEADAQTWYEDRLERFRTDPALIAQVERAIALRRDPPDPADDYVGDNLD